MTSWPWMKGIDVAIADPCPPLNAYDKRPSLKELISKHGEVIARVKANLSSEPLYDENKHDALWILRFVLSHKGNVKSATQAARGTLYFRQERNLDETDIRFNQLHNCRVSESTERFKGCSQPDAFRYVLPDVNRGVVGFLAFCGIDQHALARECSLDDWLDSLLYLGEWNYQWLDFVSRRTGRLTKGIRILDLSGFRLAMFNRVIMKPLGVCMKETEDRYPQSLQKLFVVNAPASMQMTWRITRPIIPKRVMEKVDIIDPFNKRNELYDLLAFVSEKNLPTRLGGKNKIWPVDFPLSRACVPITTVDEKSPLVFDEISVLTDETRTSSASERCSCTRLLAGSF